MTQPLTFAVIGAGNRGLMTYAQFAEHFPEKAKVVAVAEPREWFREEAIRLHKIPKENVFKSWEELVSQPRLADAAIIATQDQDHTGPALRCIEQGYDILLEKPMATTEKECRNIVEACSNRDIVFAVCHVLRYTRYFQKLREIVESGELGQVCSIRHMEQVGFWHYAHSFVRGNWRRVDQSSPMILAKSCHDMDILLYLLGKRCQRLSSFGSLSHFTPENRPEGAAERCMDCSLADGECPYSAKAYYLGEFAKGERDWPLNVITQDMSEAGIERALREGPYGRCAYTCDNDVVDHQVVALEFEDGVSATFTMSAFTEKCCRKTHILGSHGELVGDEEVITVTDFRTRTSVDHRLDAATDVLGGHGGGDLHLMEDFVEAVRTRKPAGILSGPEISLESHLMAFAAERSRLKGTVEKI